MLAVSHGRLLTARLLLNCGAEINARDEDGSTALMCAVEHDQMEAVKLLLSKPNCDSTIADAVRFFWIFNSSTITTRTASKNIVKIETYREIIFYQKLNLHYTRVITPKRVTSSGDHLLGLAPGQHGSKETSQRWRAVGDTVSNLTDPGIEPRLPAPIAVSLATTLTGRCKNLLYFQIFTGWMHSIEYRHG